MIDRTVSGANEIEKKNSSCCGMWRHRMMWFLSLIFAMLLFFATADYFWFRGGEAVLTGEKDRLSPSEKAELVGRIKCISREAEEKNHQLLLQFDRKTGFVIPLYFERAHRNVAAVADKYSSSSQAFALCCALLRDKVTKDETAANEIMEELAAKIFIPCRTAQKRGEKELNELLVRLADNDVEYSIALAMELDAINDESSQNEADRKFLQDICVGMNDAGGKIIEFGMNRSFADVGAGLEIIFARSTAVLLQRVFAKTLGRLTGVGVTGTVAAAADGPLPVGDVIGVGLCAGGAAWSVYDIYQATMVLPMELNAHLHNAISKYETEVTANLRFRAEEAVKRHNQQYRSAAEKFIGQLK